MFLWKANVKIFELFFASITQLRTSFGGVIGLDYVAVSIVAKSLNIDLTAEVFYGIGICEQELLKITNKDNT